MRGRRPSLLGSFDEETCRFFLQQLGESVVPYFPFYYGIEQVYEVLLARYGADHVADAMSVLHELLEEDSVAIGIGDEGDAWRSWRYDWKHRNDNPLDPASPRVGNYLLPPPTPKRVRLVKSANFLALQNSACVAHVHSDVTECVASETLHFLPSALSSSYSLDSQAYRLLEDIAKAKGDSNGDKAILSTCSSEALAITNRRTSPPGSLTPDVEVKREQDQQFVEIDLCEGLVDPDDPLLVSFVMMHPQEAAQPSSHGHPSGDLDIRTFHQVAGFEEGQGKPNTRGLDSNCSHCRSVQNRLQSFSPSIEDAIPRRVEGEKGLTLQSECRKPDFYQSPLKAAMTETGMSSQSSSSLGAYSGDQFMDEDHRIVRERCSQALDNQLHNVVDNSNCEGMLSNLSAADLLEDDSRLSANLGAKHRLGQAFMCEELEKRQVVKEEQDVSMERSSKREAVFDLLDGRTRYYQGTLSRSQRPPRSTLRQKLDQSQESSLHHGCKTLADQHRTASAPLNLTKQTARQHNWAEKFFWLLGHGKSTSSDSQVESDSEGVQGSATGRTRYLQKSHTWACSSPRSISPAEVMASRPRPTLVFYDGPCDEPDRSLSKSVVNLNKELPPSPFEVQDLSDKLPRSTTSPHPLQSFVQNSINSPTTSNVSSLSSQSTKAQFRGIAHEMMHAGDSSQQGKNLSPVDERHIGTDPIAMDRPEEANDHRVDHISYSSIMAGNPYREAVNIVKPANANGEEVAQAKQSKVTFQPRHVPHAMSENNISYLCSQEMTKSVDYYMPPHLHENDHPVKSYATEKALPSVRGRTRARTPSPSKALSDVQEELGDIFQHPKSSRKRSCSPHKKMFGDHGWLNRSQSARNLPKEGPEISKQESPRKTGLKQWGEKMRRRIGELVSSSKFQNQTGKVTNDIEATPATGRPLTDRSTFAISLNPPTQARFYGELELMLCVSGNKFLMEQYERGRMSADSVAKVNASWQSKNRAQVREFQYDQLTQRELILANLKTFEFYGHAGRNAIALNGILESWKILAKEMNVRTFCTADSQIKRHLLDARRVLEILGTPVITFLAFQELQSATQQAIHEYQMRKRVSQGQRGEESKGILGVRLDPIGDISFGGSDESSNH